MLVKISSLVGGNPEWHSGDPLTISFKKVLPTETVRALWDKVRTMTSILLLAVEIMSAMEMTNAEFLKL